MRILPKSSVQAAKLPSGESTTDSACLRLSGKPYLKKRKPPDNKILVLIRYIRVPNASSIVLSTMKNLCIDGYWFKGGLTYQVTHYNTVEPSEEYLLMEIP